MLFVVLSLTSDVFLTQQNLLNLAGQQAPVAILAFAFTWLLINGEFDLSAGAIVVLAGVIAANLHDEVGTWWAFAIGIAVAAVCGVVQRRARGLRAHQLVRVDAWRPASSSTGSSWRSPTAGWSRSPATTRSRRSARAS